MAAVASSLANIRGLLEKAQSARAEPAAAATPRKPYVNKENAAGIKTLDTPVTSSYKVAGKRKAKDVKSKDVTEENVLGELKNINEKNTNGKSKKSNIKMKEFAHFKIRGENGHNFLVRLDELLIEMG